MKKSFIAMGLAAASTLFFSNCAKVEVASNGASLPEGAPFEVIVNTEATKTTNDGLNTKWAAKDEITVFHAEAGATSYGSNDKFTVTGDGANSFTGTLTEQLDMTKSYDWYAIYPYNSNYKTPANTTCYQQIANNLTQNGYNSTAHLDGNKFPLVGKAKAVDGGTTPKITMKQICAVIKVVVTNNSGESLKIATASITSEKVNLAGGYFINFAGDEPVIVDENVGKPENDKYMFKTVNLTVQNGTDIADKGTAALYLAVKPFTAQNETLKIAVNGYEKNCVIGAEAVDFKSGHIKTVNFNFDKAPAKLAEGEYAIMAYDGSKYYAISKDSNGTTARRDRIEVNYDGTSNQISVGEKLIWTVKKVEGGYTFNNGADYFGAAKNTVPMVTSEKAALLSVVGSDGKWTVAADCGSDGTRYLAMNNSYGFGFYGSGTGVSNLFFIPATLSTTPTLTLNKTSIDDLPAAGCNDVLPSSAFTLKNAELKDVTATCDGTVVTFVQVQTNGIAYTVSPTPGAARQGWIKLALAGQEPQQITINQLGLDSENSFTITSDAVVTNSAYKKYEETVDNRGWLISFGGNNKSVGTNSGNRSNCNLASYAKYAVSPVTTTDVASVFACTTKLTGVKKISYTFNGGSNAANTNVYVIYSANGDTFSQIELTSGTQGAAISTDTTYEFTPCDGYFALLLKATNTSGNWRIDDVNITFTYNDAE